jgi:hypothetical protein
MELSCTICLWFKAAYDSIDRSGLFKAMEEFHVPRKLRCLVELTHKTVICRVKTFNGITESFETKKGLRQGDVLLCLLFNLALQEVIAETSLDTRGTILHKPLQILAYADDVATIGRYERTVKESYVKLKKAAPQMGLTINEEKTRYMEVGSNKPKRSIL